MSINSRALARGVLGATPVVAVVGVALAVASEEGLAWSAALRAGASIVALQVAPGVLLWRLVGPRRASVLEDVALGGAGLGGVLAVAAVALPGPTTPWAVGLALAVLAVSVAPPWRHRVTDRATSPVPALLPAAVLTPALLLVPGTQAFFRDHPVAWSEGFRAYYYDMPFHLAIAGQVGERGATTFPHVSTEALHYHWFSHAWVAQVASTSGTELVDVMLRILPTAAIIATPVVVAAVAWRCTSALAPTALASLLAVAAADLRLTSVGGNQLVAHLSPSLAPSIILSCVIVVLLLTREDDDRPPTAHLSLLFALGVVLAGTKGSALPVLVGGALFAATMTSVGRRAVQRHETAEALTLAAALAAASIVVFGGGSPGLSLSVTGALRQARASAGLLDMGAPSSAAWALASGLLVFSALARGAGVIPMLRSRRLWERTMPVLLLGTGLAGAGAVLVFTHDGRSQYYFLRNAAPFLAVLSAWGLQSAHRAMSRRSGWISAAAGVTSGLAAAVLRLERITLLDTSMPSGAVTNGLLMTLGVATAAGLAAAALGSEARSRRFATAMAWAILTVTTVPSAWAMATTGPGEEEAVEPGSTSSFSADQVIAARALRDASAPDALVATNRHCNNAAQRCDNRRFSLAAFTERQMLVEGWGYTDETARRATPDLDDAYVPYWRPELLATNDAFFETPSDDTARALTDLGVQWVFVDRTAPHDPAVSAFGAVLHESQYAIVIRLP